LEVQADHCTRSSAEVKNEWSYKPTPHIYVTIMCTGTDVTFYIYCNVIYKITGSHLQLY